MPVTFYIPAPLRPFSDGRSEVQIETSTSVLCDALAALWAQYPGIRDRVVDEQGQIREHVNVFVGNENVRYTGVLQTRLPNDAEITILPAISGG
jgi:molybdopterin converting factor small subunit